MLRTYYYSTIVSGIVSIVVFALLLFSEKIGIQMMSVENICVGIFSSALLLFCSSLIGYICEENRLLKEYHWKLSELKRCALEISTFWHSKNALEIFYEIIKSMDQLLSDYFGIVDTSFMFYRRKKIQKFLEIHSKLEPLKKETTRAIIRTREYMSGNCDENGEKIYNDSSFRNDIKKFLKMIDNYDNSGMKLVKWLENKEIEYADAIMKNS